MKFNSSRPPTELSVQGKGASTTCLSVSDTVDTSSKAGAPGRQLYLGAMDVVDEALSLLARLDGDRLHTMKALLHEQQRAKALQKRTDDLAARRLTEFVRAVQGEHEASVNNLNELNFHLTYRSLNEQKVKGRVEVADLFNKRLQEDIAFVQKHCPLVDEKLTLELQAMTKIREAQTSTDQELDAASQREAKTLVRRDDARTRAQAERQQLRAGIEHIQKELQHANEELAEAHMLYNSYVHQTGEAQQTIRDNAEEFKVLNVRADNGRAKEAMQMIKVEELQEELRLLEHVRHKLEQDNFQLQSAFDVMVSTNSERAAELRRIVEHEENTLNEAKQVREELSVENDDLLRKIERCDKTAADSEKAIKRMNKQIANAEASMNALLDESSKAQLVNAMIRDKLQEEKERISQVEDAIKVTVETLRKQVRDEIHTRNTLNARITTDSSELVKSQGEAVQRKEKLSTAIVDLEESIKVVLGKVEDLRGVYSARREVQVALEAEIEEVLAKRAAAERSFTEARDLMTPALEKLKEEKAKLDKQIERMQWQMGQMEKKCEEMEASIRIMLKSLASQEGAASRSKVDLSEYSLQLEATEKINAELQRSLDSIIDRIERNKHDHTVLVKERHVSLSKTKEVMKAELAENSKLASCYRRIQNEHFELKNKVMDLYDEQNRLEAAIKDVKQLSGLQARMHIALETYYKYRGLYNSAELGRVSVESLTSAVRVGELQTAFDESLSSVAEFLRSQMDGNQARSVAIAKLRDMPVELEAS